MASNSSSAVGKTFKTACWHLCGDGEAFSGIGFAKSTKLGNFLRLSLRAIWRREGGGETSNGKGQKSDDLHVGGYAQERVTYLALMVE